MSLALVLCAASALAFSPGSPVLHATAAHRPAVGVSLMAKGFGKQAPPPKKKVAPKTKSAGAVKRDAAASAMDDMKSQGLPEYMVLVREVPEGASPSEWYPVGGICVPRSSSESVALSMAIFNNEEDLLKGAYRRYPKLKTSTNKLEYGYRLAEFADDEIKLANKEATEQSDNPLLNWFNALDTPLNDGSGWFNPLKK